MWVVAAVSFVYINHLKVIEYYTTEYFSYTGILLKLITIQHIISLMLVVDRKPEQSNGKEVQYFNKT